MDERDPIIVSAARTPIGDFGGSLRNVSHTKLAALVMDEVCRRANFPKEELDDVYWGIVMPRSDENGVARAVKGAALNVRTNLSSLEDDAVVESLHGELAALEDRASKLVETVERGLAERI